MVNNDYHNRKLLVILQRIYKYSREDEYTTSNYKTYIIEKTVPYIDLGYYFFIQQRLKVFRDNNLYHPTIYKI